MANTQVKGEAQSEQLIQAVAQMSETDFKKFLERVNELRSKPKRRKASRREAELVRQIRQRLPLELENRYKKLRNKRRKGALTEDDERQLIEVVTEIERLNVRYVEALAELSKLRKQSVKEVMTDLGIETPKYE